MSDPKQDTRDLAARYAAAGDPNGWFEEFYARAEGDIHRVYWADLAPHPHLVAWLERNGTIGRRRAAVVGCGLGDDAEILAQHGYEVTAFDISPAAVAMCRQRYPGTEVDYVVGDLFDPPAGWRHGFDLVFECNTIQALVGEMRTRSLPAIADLVAPGGVVLVSCRSREPGEKEDEFPVPICRLEIGRFVTEAGLREQSLLAYDDTQDPPVPHFFAIYQRPAAA